MLVLLLLSPFQTLLIFHRLVKAGRGFQDPQIQSQPTPIVALTTSPLLWNSGMPPGTVTPPLPEQSVPLPHHSFVKETFPIIQSDPSLMQLEVITSHPIAVTGEQNPTPTLPQSPGRR